MGGALRAARLGKSRRLIFLLSRYGHAIEADLAERGWDLARLWQRRRIRFLLNLIDHLPRTSHFTEAVAQDDDLAEHNRHLIGEAGPRKPPVSEFGPAEELLAAIYDELAALRVTLLAVNGGKPREPKPWPRPETARERLRRRNGQADFLDIIAKAAPHDLHRFN